MRVINNHGLMSTYTITQGQSHVLMILRQKRKVKRLQMLEIKPKAHTSSIHTARQ